KLHGQNRSLKDFLAIASSLSVSHLHVLTAPPNGTSLRILRFANGPTLTFRVESFTLREDVVALQRRPVAVDDSYYAVAPIVILNNFNLRANPPEVALMEATFQSLFPTINVQLT